LATQQQQQLEQNPSVQQLQLQEQQAHLSEVPARPSIAQSAYSQQQQQQACQELSCSKHGIQEEQQQENKQQEQQEEQQQIQEQEQQHQGQQARTQPMLLSLDGLLSDADLDDLLCRLQLGQADLDDDDAGGR
jgi:hypothetical protein